MTKRRVFQQLGDFGLSQNNRNIPRNCDGQQDAQHGTRDGFVRHCLRLALGGTASQTQHAPSALLYRH